MMHPEWFKQDIIITAIGGAIAILAVIFLKDALQTIVTTVGIFMMVGTMVNRLFKGYRTEE